MDTDFLKARITATKTQITELETAISNLQTGEIQQYTLDTGQSRQVVMLHDVVRLQKMLDSLYNRLCTLEARLNGSGQQVSPAW